MPRPIPKQKTLPAKCFPDNPVAKSIRAVPLWAPVQQGSLAEIQKSLDPLRRFPLSAIRKGMELYVAYSVAAEHYGVGEMGRLYLVNRYVLAIPGQIPSEQDISFGGWIVDPDLASNPLWPFSIRNGKLQLTERFKGYAGAPYDALGEFDHFVGYGPRWKGTKAIG